VAGKKKIGVLALQGAFIEHEKALKKCNAKSIQIRTPAQLAEIDGLIIPGGESTTIGKLMQEYGLDKAIQQKYLEGMPIWGTCAGMILLAKQVVDSEQFRLGLMDIRVKRNAYGRQINSFEADLEIIGVGKTRGIFIRAPYVENNWGDTRVIAKYHEKIVAVQQGNKLLSTAFHPELTEGAEIHDYFLSML
jgi:5'-phosphate synthase pdxT subunit